MIIQMKNAASNKEQASVPLRCCAASSKPIYVAGTVSPRFATLHVGLLRFSLFEAMPSAVA